jgi:hypothetical protein
MKKQIITLGFAGAVTLITACGSEISGEYKGAGMTLEFKSNNTVYVKIPGLQTKTNYSIDDDKIIISMSSYPDIVLQRNSKSLIGPLGVELKKNSGWW